MTEAAPRPIKVLIVDDEPDIVEALVMRFQSTRLFAIETARDGREGLAKVRAFRPDILLLDLVMPDLDGWDVCAALRSDPATKNLPIVMMTAFSGSRLDEAKAAAAGLHRVVFKPFDLDKLVETLKNAAPR